MPSSPSINLRELMDVATLTIVGVGLIGGSVGLAARRRGVARHVLGIGCSDDGLARAVARGAIDESTRDPARALARSDVVVVCTPVDSIPGEVLSLAAHCRPGTLMTDVGSTKAAIVSAVEGRLPRGVAFVGSHPLAGSEKSGPDHARADLFQDRLVVVTPTPHTDPAAVERTCAFWQALGSRVRLMSPIEHDRALALTSHLPHLAAAALAGVLPPELFDLTATGFRDTTRVAAGDPALWSGIFRQNRAAVLEALDQLTERLGRFRDILIADDVEALDSFLGQGKKVRDALGGPRGPSS
jgi:prephenate dehydrogenase